MNWKTKGYFILLFCFVACKGEKERIKLVSIGENALVEAEQLLNSAAFTDIKIIDFRKKEAYLKGHIPNAIQLWRSDIEDNSYSYKGMMASKEHIEHLFSEMGIRSDDTLVLYDDNGSCDAARLWWVLKCYGFDQVKILNGGVQAWKTANALFSKTLPTYKKSTFSLPKTNARIHYINRQKLKELLQDSVPYYLLDTRTTDEFSGKRQKAGAIKAGRIPTSHELDWAHSVDLKGTQKFKSILELESLFESLQIPKNAEIIAYCHSGVRSAHTTFVLTELLGYKNVKNYDGSWTEWSHFDDLPFEKDSITVILQ